MQSSKCHPNSLPSLFQPDLQRGVQFVTFEAARLAFDFEPATDPSSKQTLLVFVNGFQRSRLDFRAVRRRLHANNPNIATLAIDNRGIGETEVDYQTQGHIDESLRIGRMARDAVYLAESFARVLNSDSYAMLGVSMGGMICLEAAVAGANVSHLILVSTTAGGALRSFSPGELDSPDLRMQHRSWPDNEDDMRRYARRFFGRQFLQNSPLIFNAIVKGMLQHRANDAFRTHASWQSDGVMSFDAVSGLQDITCPTLILSGNEDDIIPHENSVALNKYIRGSQLTIYPSVGHMILIEAADRFVEDISLFLQPINNG